MAILGLFPVQILQEAEADRDLIRIHERFSRHPDRQQTSGRHGADALGDSVAHWEGDTLAVDMAGFNAKTWLTATGFFTRMSFSMTERYTRVGKDQINYEATMVDPKVLTKPWTVRSTMMLRKHARAGATSAPRTIWIPPATKTC